MKSVYLLIWFLASSVSSLAQIECKDCLKTEVLKNEYYDAYKKIPNGYVVDERGDTFDFNLLDLKLTFSTSNVNYMVYAGAFDAPVYYGGDNTVHGLGHATNLDSFTHNLPYSVVLVENQQGEIKLLSTGPEKEYPGSQRGTELSVGFYRSFKISDDSNVSMQIQVSNISLRIRESDTLIRLHYLYRPSIGYLRDYVQRKVSLTLYKPYADSARCNDCSNVHLTSNWFRLTPDKEVRIIRKEAIDDLLSPTYRAVWPSKDNFQGNGLYYLIIKRVKYFEDKVLVLHDKRFYQEDITVVPLDSSKRPVQLLIPERGLILNVYNKDQNDTNTGFIYSIILDLEGRHSQYAYRDQLPVALNYGDKLSDLKKRYLCKRVVEEGRYVHLYLNETYYPVHAAKITFDQELQRISEVEILYGGSADSFR